MATMNVSLPDPMKQWVEDQKLTGSYSNASDYVRDLIRKDQDRKAKIAAMQSLINEAFESGKSELSMTEIKALASQQLNN